MVVHIADFFQMRNDSSVVQRCRLAIVDICNCRLWSLHVYLHRDSMARMGSMVRVLATMATT